jgi:hypothetical protein
MRYTVDPAELGRAAEQLVRNVAGRGLEASRALGQVGRGLPGGLTASALPELLLRWRARERRLGEGLASHAQRVERAAHGYADLESAATSETTEAP